MIGMNVHGAGSKELVIKMYITQRKRDLFGWIEKYNKNRIRLNKYYICTIIDNEAVLDNKPKWVYFNADSAKFLKYRQEEIDIIRNNYKGIKISTIKFTNPILPFKSR